MQKHTASKVCTSRSAQLLIWCHASGCV